MRGEKYLMQDKSTRKVVLLTTTHLSKNPRLVKEINALYRVYAIEVVYFIYHKKLSEFDLEIEESYPAVKFTRIDWTSKFIPERLFLTFFSKTLNLLYKFTGYDLLPEQRLFKGFFSLYRKVTSIKADSYNAHNIGALSSGVLASKNNKAIAIFDAEDYHRGELAIDTDQSKLIIHLENKYIPKLRFLTAASPLTEKAYKEHYPFVDVCCINNAFPAHKLTREIKTIRHKLKMVWFSQHVGTDRGLENIIKGLNLLPHKILPITIDIFGESSVKLQNYFNQLLNHEKVTLCFRGVVSPSMLEEILINYDIGIASEIGNTLNRKFCLTNKIFTYIQAGLAILASDTPAQGLFMNQYADVGLVYENENNSSITLALEAWLSDLDLLRSNKINSMRLSKNELNWGNEQQKILTLISHAFQ